MESNDKEPQPDKSAHCKQPPEGTRFKPGQSGNPNGRPKGSSNLSAQILRQLRQPITVMKGGKPFKTTKAGVIASQTVGGSMKGDHKSIALVLKIDQDAANAQSAPSGNAADFVIPDKENLKLIAKRLRRLTGEE